MIELIRHFAGLIVLVVAYALCLVAQVGLVIANYLATSVSFEFLGFDKQPLRKEPFVGKLIGVFFPEMTIFHLLAGALSVIVALALILIYNRIFHIWHLCEERRFYLGQNDPESAHRVNNQIKEALFVIVLIGIPVTIVLLWDYHLFVYRWLLGAMSLDDPAVAPGLVKRFGLQMQENGHLYAWAITYVGAFGYLALTATACGIMEYFWDKTKEKGFLFLTSIKKLITPPLEEEQQFYGYDVNGHPVYEPHTPIMYDTNGNPVPGSSYSESHQLDGTNVPVSSETSHTEQNNEPWMNEPSATQQTDKQSTRIAAATQEARHEDATVSNANSTSVVKSTAFPAPLFNADEVFRGVKGHAGRRTDDSQLKEVIGVPGVRIRQAEALTNNDRFWIDPDNLEIWDRAYRGNLFPERRNL